MKSMLIIVPGLAMGGTERIACNVVDVLKDTFHVTLAVFGRKNAFFSPNCEVIDLELPAVAGTVKKTWNVLKRAAALRRLKRERKFDYCMAFGGSANLPAILSGDGHTVVTTLHLWEGIQLIKRTTFLYRKCLKIGCVSELMAQEIEKRYPSLRGKTATIYNPYNITEIRRMGCEEVGDYAFEGRVLINHGRLEDVKNLPRLIKAFSLVHNRCPDTKLLIVGEGSRRGQLEDMILQYHLEDCVTLLGSRENPFSYLSKATLFVGSSFHEGFPNSLVEAMAFCPAVMVDCQCGPREILSNGPIDRVCTDVEEAEYGILVPPAKSEIFSMELTEDDCVLAKGILSILEDQNKLTQYREKARMRAEMFNYAAYRDRIIKLFEGNESTPDEILNG